MPTSKQNKPSKSHAKPKASAKPVTLTDADKKVVLFDLNDVAPDTLDEGAYSNWKFSDLSRDGDKWTLRFTNSGHPTGDYVTFEYAGPCVVDRLTNRKWEDAAFEALREDSGEFDEV